MTTSIKDKSLDRFLDVIHTNQQLVRNNIPEHYSIIRRVDDCFVEMSEHLINPKPTFAGPLFLRAHYAYKTAAGMTLGGQVVEPFAIMRSCLEYAGYALAIFADPRLGADQSREEVFISRHIDDVTMKAQKETFKISKIRGIITDSDPKLAEQFQSLYDLCINFGAHPNPNGLLLAMNIERTPDKSTVFTTLALTGDPDILKFVMKNVAWVGLTALYIFEKIFRDKFEMLGIRPKLDVLSSTPF